MEDVLTEEEKSERLKLDEQIYEYKYLLKKCLIPDFDEDEQEDIYDISVSKLEFLIQQAEYLEEKAKKNGEIFHKKIYISRMFIRYSKNFKTYEDGILYLIKLNPSLTTKYYKKIYEILFNKSDNYLRENNVNIDEEVLNKIDLVIRELMGERIYSRIEEFYLTVDSSLKIKLNNAFNIYNVEKRK